jgi:hypothetical protein
MPDQNTPPRRGPAASRWKGGTTRHLGRVYVRKPGHPRATKDDYVFRYVLVAEEMLGRSLAPGEVVHHLNGVKDDDRPENLAVMTQSEHRRLHIQQSGVMRGEAHPGSKLTWEKVRTIRSRYAAGGISLKRLAQEYGCSIRNIGLIVHDKAWREGG